MSDTPPTLKEMSDKSSMLLTGRQYAAIHLCVPDSGEKWLDDMITRTLRDRIAAAALRGLLDEGHGLREIADECYLLADAMLERRKR